MVIGGGAENCWGAEDDTAAPWAPGEALLDGEADADAEADGFGSGLSTLLICAEEGGEAAGLAGAAVGAAGAAFWPHAVSSNINPKSAMRKRSVKQCSHPPLERDSSAFRQLYWANR